MSLNRVDAQEDPPRGGVSRVAIWMVIAILGGALLGALIAVLTTGWSDVVTARNLSGSWRWAIFDRAGVDWWAGGGALVAFVVVMSFVAWRMVVGALMGVTLGAILGNLVGDAANTDDFSAPVDWAALVGLLLGAVIGTVAGIALGTIWHLHREATSREG